MLELMFIQSAVLLCSSSKKNHDSSQKSSITAPGEAVQEKRRVHMLWYKNENLGIPAPSKGERATFPFDLT